jgi:CRP/FNR family cyclic AMP-dependent transcriptional regulator
MDRAAAVTRGWTAFERLPPKLREGLIPLGQQVGYGAGDLVFGEGETTPFLGAVESGRIALRYRVPELGNRVTIVTIEPGEIVGWSAVVAPFRATADAVATEPTRLLVFEAGPLRERLEADSELAAAFLPLILEAVSRRLTTSWHQLLDLFAARGQGPW